MHKLYPLIKVHLFSKHKFVLIEIQLSSKIRENNNLSFIILQLHIIIITAFDKTIDNLINTLILRNNKFIKISI